MYALTPFARGFFNAFDDLDDAFLSSASATANCRVDIREKDNGYVIDAELPGFNKEDITLDINGDCLTIKAKHTANNDKQDENGKYIRRERSVCSYERSFDISEIDADKITAAYNNGILSLDMPKKQAVQPASRRLQIN
ncbi:MAG: Hsp20/alpha crystallin family protein [Oscillospiraceae bacterium]|nr:Hsp20/alpha crystallin family protein [Oscillospiraceae bacterium]